MDRRLALVALWAMFAAASVGVGFGAAGLVGGPFSDGVADAAVLDTSSDSPGLLTAETPGPELSPSPTGSSGPTSGATTEPGPASTGEPARTGGATGASTRAVPARSVTRSITTRGGLVSATCRTGLVQASGSPAVGWEIEDIDGGAQRYATVRFEQPDGDSRVDVEARCWRGAPRFALDDDEDSGGGGDDDGDGDAGDAGYDGDADSSGGGDD